MSALLCMRCIIFMINHISSVRYCRDHGPVLASPVAGLDVVTVLLLPRLSSPGHPAGVLEVVESCKCGIECPRIRGRRAGVQAV